MLACLISDQWCMIYGSYLSSPGPVALRVCTVGVATSSRSSTAPGWSSQSSVGAMFAPGPRLLTLAPRTLGLGTESWSVLASSPRNIKAPSPSSRRLTAEAANKLKETRTRRLGTLASGEPAAADQCTQPAPKNGGFRAPLRQCCPLEFASAARPKLQSRPPAHINRGIQP